MTERVLYKTCVIPANTPQNSPVSFSLAFTPSDVERIDIRVPPGPAGLMGFYIGNGGGQYIPEGTGNFIIGDDDRFSWSLQNAPNNGNWTIVAYNLDVITHTIYVTFNINQLVLSNVPASGGLVGL